jgi:hypothetical protein
MQVLTPHVTRHDAARQLIHCTATRLADLQPGEVEASRADLFERIDALQLDEDTRLQLRIVLSVLCDLRSHDWVIEVGAEDVRVTPPDRAALHALEHKAGVREGLRVERDAQLREPSTQRFIRRMERRRPHRDGWQSIFSVMRDGPQLAADLRAALEISTGHLRIAALRAIIDPYVQIVEPGVRCEYSGLDLQDIWRYFRHTWATPYRSVPGRQISFLIRDRAAKGHPVIGIGALASSVIQQSRRDKWIGWHPTIFVEAMEADRYKGWSSWLNDRMSELLKDIYVADFRSEGLLTSKDLTYPSIDVIQALRRVCTEARAAHRLYRQEHQHKGAGAASGVKHWRAQAQTHLFRSKRAGTLAQLLQARYDLNRAGFNRSSPERLKRALETPHGRRAVRTILRLVKASHVGIDMMDIVVCGAVAPYAPILGGKLVSMLLASPDVIRAYEQRYRDTSSIIASSMAGRPVSRSPRLVLLMTTSLYRVASSQYNRLKVPAQYHGGGGTLEFIDLEHTAGFGSYHFSKATVDAMEVLLARAARGREVNSIFGEGVNPKLRKMRSALNIVGLPTDHLLKHGSPRIVYGVPLASNFREILIGRERRPRYISADGSDGTDGIIRFWFERWLSRRIERDGVLDAVAQHSTSYPVEHGARVDLPGSQPEEPASFFAMEA